MSNVKKELHNKVQEAHIIPNRHDQKRNTPQQLKMCKNLNIQNEEKILKAARKKKSCKGKIQVISKGRPIRIACNFYRGGTERSKGPGELIYKL